ncbi:chabaupain 1 [Plasmodium vinckei brucechwatti]|uniref:Chabaupain 1 n=4 Tax=Plasmodium vinckei brucechwatti TaxID=119398 RepID=A0A6V7SN22_PLAVN|nr:chabaupain 1 [Plasmodium vinckei brucechwatti]
MMNDIRRINFTANGIESLNQNSTYLKRNPKKAIKICAYAITAIALFFIGGVYFKNQTNRNALKAIDEAELMNREIAHLREILKKYKTKTNEDNEFGYQNNANINGDSEDGEYELLLMLHKLLKNNANKVNTFDINNESNRNIDHTDIFSQKLESMQDNIKYASKFFKYMKEYNKKYNNMDEQLERFENFKRSHMKVQKHNEMIGKNGVTYVQKVNQYSDFSKDEFDNYFKKLPSIPHDLKAKHVVPLKTHLANNNITLKKDQLKGYPDHRDYRDKFYLLPPKDQGMCGSCWAFATVASFEFLFARAMAVMPISFSEQQLVDCSTDNAGCDGGHPFYALLYFINNGVCLGDEYPYKALDDFFCLNYRCSFTGKFHYIGEAKPNELIMALNEVGPVTIAVGVTDEFVLYSGGIFDGPCNPVLNHSVLLVGYGQVKKSLAFDDSHSNVDSNLVKKYKENIKGNDDDDTVYYWIVRNSWGPNWGEGGYIRLKRNEAGDDVFCGVGIDVLFPIY